MKAAIKQTLQWQKKYKNKIKVYMLHIAEYCFSIIHNAMKIKECIKITFIFLSNIYFLISFYFLLEMFSAKQLWSCYCPLIYAGSSTLYMKQCFSHFIYVYIWQTVLSKVH